VAKKLSLRLSPPTIRMRLARPELLLPASAGGMPLSGVFDKKLPLWHASEILDRINIGLVGRAFSREFRVINVKPK
jgi:hypothetical protein